MVNGGPLLDYYQNLAQTTQGKELGTYCCTDGGLTRNLTAYFRRISWEAQRMGMSSVGMWTSAGVNNTNTWDDFTAAANYEMIFATPSTATDHKILTAWRDGVQDFEYFKVLEDLIDRGASLSIPSALLTSAQNLIDTLPAAAIANTADSTTFDQARVQLLEQIDTLAAAATPTSCAEAWELGQGLLPT